MDKQFYRQKIRQLSDDRLRELLQLKNNENSEIMIVAENEALKRGIDLATIKIETKVKKEGQKKPKKEKGVNWTGVLADILSGLS